MGVVVPSGFTYATGEFNVPDLKGVKLLSLVVVATGMKNVLTFPLPDFKSFRLPSSDPSNGVQLGPLLEYLPTSISSCCFAFKRCSDEK